LANYSQPSYVTPYVTNSLAPYETNDTHNLVPHLYNGHSRISSGNSIGAYEPSSTTVAYGTSPAQLWNFGSIQVSFPNESRNAGEQAYPSWAEAKAKYMARINEVKPKPAEDNNNEYTTPTFDELPIEHRQAYEVIKKKREEEHL
jgi:phosphorylcholine metabolism protein LicD